MFRLVVSPQGPTPLRNNLLRAGDQLANGSSNRSESFLLFSAVPVGIFAHHRALGALPSDVQGKPVRDDLGSRYASNELECLES